MYIFIVHDDLQFFLHTSFFFFLFQTASLPNTMNLALTSLSSTRTLTWNPRNKSFSALKWHELLHGVWRRQTLDISQTAPSGLTWAPPTQTAAPPVHNHSPTSSFWLPNHKILPSFHFPSKKPQHKIWKQQFFKHSIFPIFSCKWTIFLFDYVLTLYPLASFRYCSIYSAGSSWYLMSINNQIWNYNFIFKLITES